MLWIYIEANEILNILTSLGKMQRINYYVTYIIYYDISDNVTWTHDIIL